MPRPDLKDLSIRQIRDLVDAEGADDDLLETLDGDERKGIQSLVKRLRRQRREARAEQARLEKLTEIERALHQKGIEHIAGVDEAGRGPLAGPVVAAAVVLPEGMDLPGLNDSKALSAMRREALYGAICEQALTFAIGQASVEEIDRLNILQATMLAMRRAIGGLQTKPDQVLIDGNTLPESGLRELAIVDGDARSASISAASILAKVTRDRLMVDLDARYPGYGLARHKGYGSPDHLAALRRQGPSPIHRTSFHSVGSPDGAKSDDFNDFAQGIDLAADLRELEAIGNSVRLAGADLVQEELDELRNRYRAKREALSRTGPWGEQAAQQQLERTGYSILARQFRAAGGEIDIVAANRDVLAFVEVKTGTGTGFAAPESWVTPKKQRQITRVARAYLQRHPQETRTSRFDVLVVERKAGQVGFRHLQDAFRAET